MCDRRAEGRLLGPLGIDVDELVIASGVCEQVDLRLIDGEAKPACVVESLTRLVYT